MSSTRALLAALLSGALAFAPLAAHAQSSDAKSLLKKKKKKKKKPEPEAAPTEEQPAEKEDVYEKRKKAVDEFDEKAPEKEEKSDEEKDKSESPPEKEEEKEPIEAITAPFAISLPKVPKITGHRYAYVGGGLAALGGAAFLFSAKGEAERAKTIAGSREAEGMLNDARASAATANVFFLISAATLTYAVVMELIPEQQAEKASLTFHF